jgi:hypothetical protein
LVKIRIEPFQLSSDINSKPASQLKIKRVHRQAFKNLKGVTPATY